MKKLFTFDRIFILFTLLFCLFLWLPTRFYPYHWDAAGYIINDAQSLKNNHFTSFANQNSDFAHPPLLPLLLAIFWTLFGTTKLVSHLIIFPYLPLLVIASYYFVKTLYNRQLAVIIALLMATTPVVLAEYGNIYPDLPVAALIILAFLFWLKQKIYPAVIAFTLAVLFKESAIFYLPFFILYPQVNQLLKNPRRFAPFLIPIAALAGWFLYHYVVTGWVYLRPGRTTVAVSNFKEFYQSLTYVFWQVGIAQNRWLTSLLAGLSLLIIFFKKISTRSLKSQYLILLVTFGVVILIYTLGGEFASRYGITVMLLWYTLGLAIAYNLVNYLTPSYVTPVFVCIGLAVVIGNLIIWHPQKASLNTYDFRPPDDLSYRDMIDVFRQLGFNSQIENNNPHWYGSFPENLYLTQSYLEYVSTPVNFNSCAQFVLNENERQLIIFHPYSPGQLDCQTLLQKVNVKPYKRFSKGDRWVEIYQVTASGSASL